MGIVLGRGNPAAAGVVIGEAPGAEEDRQGRPFVGKAGQLLSMALAMAGLDEEQDLWITNVIKERPPDNRTPYNSEVEAALDGLYRELVTVHPIAVLGVGNVPLLAMTNQEGGITKERGSRRRIKIPYGGRTALGWDDVRDEPYGKWEGPVLQFDFYPTLHPSYVLRNGGIDSEAGRLFQSDIDRFAKAIRREEDRRVSFFDEYKEIGGQFVSSEEKQVLMDNGIPFQVVEIVEDPGNKFGPRYVAKVLLPDPESGTEEQRNIGFPRNKVESRDRMLQQMKEYLERDEALPVVVKLEKVGRSIIIRNAQAASE